jgi:ComF family protein
MACKQRLSGNEDMLCVTCLTELPKTQFHTDENNPVAKGFWGRVQVKAAASYYYFEHGGHVQHLLHNLKYNGQKRLGEKIGYLYGAELKEDGWPGKVDVVIPVPIHKRKQRKRGYNQSMHFAMGMANALGAVADDKTLVKTVSTQSQTKKSREERVANVKDVFRVVNPSAFENKHVLLVDDVITTGATLESCVKELQRVKGITVSIASIAYAK